MLLPKLPCFGSGYDALLVQVLLVSDITIKLNQILESDAPGTSSPLGSAGAHSVSASLSTTSSQKVDSVSLSEERASRDRHSLALLLLLDRS